MPDGGPSVGDGAGLGLGSGWADVLGLGEALGLGETLGLDETLGLGEAPGVGDVPGELDGAGLGVTPGSWLGSGEVVGVSGCGDALGRGVEPEEDPEELPAPLIHALYLVSSSFPPVVPKVPSLLTYMMSSSCLRRSVV